MILSADGRRLHEEGENNADEDEDDGDDRDG